MFATAERSHVNGKARAAHKTATKAARHVEADADDALSTIYDAASAIREDVESLAQGAGRRVREVFDETQSNVVEATDNMTAIIREKPVQASLIAMGVGVIVGFLLRRA